MKVLLTGAAGFVGAHTAAAAQAGGHEVSALVRDVGRARAALASAGARVQEIDLRVGDATDPDIVRSAVRASDAVVSCAAQVALDRRSADRVLRTNVAIARTVLRSAAEAGHDPVVHTSTAAALLGPDREVLDPSLPVGARFGGYSDSKIECEQIARDLQADGAPVVITYPGAVLGPPADQAFGEAASGIAAHLRSGLMLGLPGGWSVVDVRDVATVQVAALQRGLGPRRVLCAGTFLGAGDTAHVYRVLTGRPMPVVQVPTSLVRALAGAFERASALFGRSTLVSRDGIDLFAHGIPADTAHAEGALGIRWRPVLYTFRSAIAGLRQAGLLRPKHVGPAIAASVRNEQSRVTNPPLGRC